MWASAATWICLRGPARHAGSAVVVSMLIAAAISLLTALSFAELTAWMPKEGSVLAKLLVLILFCLLGVLYVQWVNFTPFDPAGARGPGPLGGRATGGSPMQQPFRVAKPARAGTIRPL